MDTRLLKLMNNLKASNTFFADYFPALEITEDNFEEVYENLPILRKNDIEKNLRNYIDKTFMPELNQDELLRLFQDVSDLSWNHDRTIISSGKEWRIETTTGSTGKPFSVLKSKNEKMFESRHLIKCRKKNVGNISWDNGFLLLEPRDELLKDCYRQTDENSHYRMVRHLIDNDYEWILATALQFRNLYKCIKKNKLESELVSKNIRFIETTSQALDDEEKKEYANSFPNTHFYSQYGCREVWNLAYECNCGRLHVNQEYLRIDLIDDDGRIIHDDNTEGEVIVTSYLHKSMPFFKYYLGDRCYIKHGKCECGNETPWIILSPGRAKQKLLGTELYGSQLFRKLMRFLYFHHPEYRIEKIKIIQKDMTTLNVYVLLDTEYKEDFEKTFMYECNYVIKNFERFNVNFIYEYPFVDNPKALKSEIFENFSQ